MRGIDKLGFLYIARVLKEGGCGVDFLQTDFDDPIKYLQNHKIDWVMFSIMTGEQFYVREMAARIKRLFPHIKICVGGPHVTFDPDYPKRESNVDVFVRGPGELVIKKIVEGVIKDRIVLAPFPEINSLPTPYRKIMYKYPEFRKAGMRRFITMRGCPHSCSYCFNATLRKIYPDHLRKMLQRRYPEKVIEEILEVRREFGLSYVYFNDDNFAMNRSWLDRFCKLYKKRVGLPFGTGMRADYVTRDLLRMLRNAGMVFTNFALETVDEDLQRNLLKRGGKIDNNQILKAIQWCRELGIKTRLLNMIGLPIPNPLKEALDTLKFNMKVRPTDSWAAVYQPEPNTELYYYCVTNGYLNPVDLEDTQSTQTFYGKSVLKIRDKDKIERLQRWWYFLVRYKVNLNFVKYLLEVDLSEETEKKLRLTRLMMAKKKLYLGG